MNKNPTSFEPEKHPKTPQAPIRRSVLILTAIIALGAVALVVIASRRGKEQAAGKAEPALESVGAGGLASEPGSSNAGSLRVRSRQARPPEAASLPSNPPVDARQLVKSLSEVNVQPGELTPEKAEEWHRNLVKLIEQGRAAVPPLEEFFQRKVDIKFDSAAGTNLLGEPTLRIAFMKVLFDLPTPENVDLQKKLLETTVDPGEIALLARQLQSQEPGKHRELIIETVRRALEREPTGSSPERDTKALMEVLEYHGATIPR